MAVLSDGEIGERMARGELVVGGDPARTDASSYEFRAGLVVRTGDDPAKSVIDWTDDPGPGAVYEVQPGELVWVRTRETVALPPDICAFWWQTNRLSRQGLMLVNMTMVEPGYRGPLACLFANFGRQKVVIDFDTPIARLVFFHLTRPADSPYAATKPSGAYDRDLVATASAAPRTFLNLESLSQDIKRQLNDAVANLEQRKSELARELGTVADEARRAAATAFSEDTRKTVLKAIPGSLLALALLFAAVTFVPWLQGEFSPSLGDEVRQQIDQTLDKRLNDANAPGEVDKLRAEVAELKEQVTRLGPSATPTP
jgi:deoxycytidine triphosphate deaminase